MLKYLLTLVLLLQIVRAQLIYPPTTPQVSSATDVVGFILQNPTNETLPAPHIIFAHPFSVGQIRTASPTVVLQAVGSTTMPVQVSVKATHSDGSVKHAVLIAKQPDLQNGESKPFMLTTNAAQGVGSTVDLHNFPTTSVSVSMTISQPSAQSVNIDVSQALKDALSANSVSYWFQGPLATQARVIVPVISSFRLAFDVTLFSDNTYAVDIQFLNDIAMSPVGDTLVYSATVTANGQSVYSIASLTHYQTGHYVYYSDQAPRVNVQYDAMALTQSNAVHPYNLTMGLSQGTIDEMANRLRTSDWGQPLASYGITKDMGTTGGRADIGPFTLFAAAWVVSQHDVARRHVLGWGEAAGSTALNLFAKNQSRWVNVFDYPNIWLDGRCNPYSVCPTQFSAESSWNLETAHLPSLAYVPYLITGSRYYLDRMEAIAAWVAVKHWTYPRMDKGTTELGLVVNGNQLRGSAWSMREVILASYISPDDTPMRSYYDKMIFNNLSWLNNHTAQWQADW